MDITSSGPSSASERSSLEQSQLNGGPRRAQTLMSPIDSKINIPPLTLTLTIHKDSNGYGMKVSGDQPVFVESVKTGGAAQKAGLVAGDMILKVNGTVCRSSKHTEVVQLIKALTTVELTIQRSQKMPRPTSISMGPSTPLAQRGGITAPIPVDHAKRREMEYSKMKTLRMMLDQEKKNLQNLKTTNGTRQEQSRAEANIKQLQEQLKQDSTFNMINPPATNITPPTLPIQSPSTPAFLSRFPRSLSSLSLGTKKKSVDKDTTNLTSQGGKEINSDNAISSKKRLSGSEKNMKEDIPPPLPQRNIPRKSLPLEGIDDTILRRNETVISDLDHSANIPIGFLHNNNNLNNNINNINNNNNNTNNISNNNNKLSPNTSSLSSSSTSKNKKRSKTKMKALSDPKMSSQIFIEMESSYGSYNNRPPPLPPRQPGMMEENFNNKQNNNHNRALPNSIETLMNYPLISTCTTVRENLSAYPLSYRPNIVQQLKQQHHQNQQQQQQHHLLDHHAKNSTVFGLSPQQINQLGPKHRRVLSSPDSVCLKDHHLYTDRLNKSTTGSSCDPLDKDLEETPPGTPPPPYLSPMTSFQQYNESVVDHCETQLNIPNSPNTSFTTGIQISAAQANITQKPIISMEDDELSDQEGFIDEHGPFRSLPRLLESENSSHLAVFLNFVLSNSDPAPLLFYLITGLYKEGTVKDMRKWAYEIHSTFLVPRAPLLWANVDEPLAREVDEVLQNEFDKGEILRKIFWKSRLKAKDFINTQLQEFQVKRTAGLGTMFGPSDQHLLDSRGDKTKEQKIVEDTLMPKLQQILDEIERESPNECPKKSAMCSALSTVLHRIFVTRSNPGNPIDKVHHFVSREKSFKRRLMGKNRKIMIRGHHLVLRQYYEVTHCNHCQNIIWGVSPQGFFCTDCELNIHRACSKILEENCPGPAPQKKTKDPHNDNKISKFMEKIRPTHPFIHMDRSRRQDEENCDDILSEYSATVIRQPSDRRPDSSSSVNNTSLGTGNDMIPSQTVDCELNTPNSKQEHSRDNSKSKSAPVSVNRSESYKERLSHKRKRDNRRKTSDPSLSKVTNEEQVELGLSNANLTQSSNSSLSSSLDSTSTSLEVFNAPTVVVSTPGQWIDSEDEQLGDTTEVDWSSNVDADILKTLTDSEKKRQEVINEIYITERNHVRTLRLLERIFMRPLQESNLLSSDHLQLLFPPALLILKDLHSSFESKLKQRRCDSTPLVNSIGDMLLEMFDGRSGDDLKEHAAHFCARQQIALEALKEKRRKDENLHKTLTIYESHKACRRLQLKDLLPTVLQRLTKYPLLFESLYKITLRVLPENQTEAFAIKKALESSRRILDHVNQAVRISEDTHKLQTIQKKLDKTSYEKEATNEFKNLDLTQHNLIHDGPLIMKKHPGTLLHGLLFENMMVLLQKQDDRYLLKYHSSPGTGSGESKSEVRFNPITKIHLLLVRQSAVDKNTFFLINTNVSQMLELTAPSSSECKTWFKHISDSAEAYKSRTKGNNLESTEEIQNRNITKDSFESASSDNSHPPPTPILSSQLNFNNLYDKNTDDHSVIDDKLITNNDSSCVNKENLDKESSVKSDDDDADDDDDDDDDESEENDEDEKTEKPQENKTLNEIRTLTQQCSLVAPSEVQINISPALTAEPVLTPTERLRRLDESIRTTLIEKQKIVCNMFRVPNEHFSAIADIIAGQPETSKFQEPSDIILAAFAQVQSLTEVLNDCIQVSTHQEISAVSTMLCDDCHHRNNHPSSCVNNNSKKSQKQQQQHEDDDEDEEGGYCEIEDIRNSSNTVISTPPEIKRQSTISADSIPEETEHEMNAELFREDNDSHIEINDAYDSTSQISEFNDDESTLKSSQETLRNIVPCIESCGPNRLAHVESLVPSIPCHLIAGFVTALNSQISRLLPKLEERDIERENLRKENQHLRELLNTMHERERVLKSEETPEANIEQPPTNSFD